MRPQQKEVNTFRLSGSTMFQLWNTLELAYINSISPDEFGHLKFGFEPEECHFTYRTSQFCGDEFKKQILQWSESVLASAAYHLSSRLLEVVDDEEDRDAALMLIRIAREIEAGD